MISIKSDERVNDLQLICTRQSHMSEADEHILTKMNIHVIHIAKLLPLYIIECDDRSTVILSGLFESVREAELFSIADVTFTPHLSNKHLFKIAKAVGWGIKVAVLDTGVYSDIVHAVYEKDFTGFGNRILSNHGTHVAKCILEYAPGCQILSMKIGHHGNDILEGNVIIALDDAIDQGADIINMSIQFNRQCRGDCDLCRYVNSVVDYGIPVFAAAGNFGQSRGRYSTIACPGAAERAVTIGAIGPNGKISDTSSQGQPGFQKPNLLAPGSIRVMMQYKTGNKIEPNSGTSFSTPLVTGVVASLLSAGFTIQNVITDLFGTCHQLKNEPTHRQGFGIIDIPKLIEECAKHVTIPNSSS